MNTLGEEEYERRIPPVPFVKGVAKWGDNNNEQDNISQRGYRKLNPGMLYIPYNLNIKGAARKLRRNTTMPERKFWRELLSQDKMMGLRFLRQKQIGNYIADFYCSALMLVIEVDGASHFSDEGKEYDKIRTETFGLLGIRVIRYTNKEVMENIEGIWADLKKKIEKRKIELNLN